MNKQNVFSFTTGFLLLFFIYHFPEFYSAFWIMASFKIGFLLTAVLLARVQGFKNQGVFGLVLSKRSFIYLFVGLFIGLLFFGLSFFASVQLGYQKIEAISTSTNIIKQLPVLFLMTAIPSVAEDILTRGYLYVHLKSLKPYVWIMLSSGVYVLNHIWRLNDGLAVLFYLLMLGMVLAIAVWITKSLWLAFGIHWGANIAFESSNSFVQTKSMVTHSGSTWLLAVSWSILLLLLLVSGNKQNNNR